MDHCSTDSEDLAAPAEPAVQPLPPERDLLGLDSLDELVDTFPSESDLPLEMDEIFEDPPQQPGAMDDEPPLAQQILNALPSCERGGRRAS